MVCVFQEKKELILLSENPCLFFGAFFVPSYMFLFEGWEHEPAFSKHFQTYQLQRHLYKKLRATSLFLLSALFEYGRRNTSPPNPSLPSRLTVACVSVYLLIPLCAPTTGPPYVLLAPFPFAPSVVATFFSQWHKQYCCDAPPTSVDLHVVHSLLMLFGNLPWNVCYPTVVTLGFSRENSSWTSCTTCASILLL